MTFQKSKSETLLARIRDDILNSTLVPNTPLRLPALSERYGVGVTPLRECLNRLDAEQLVVTHHNKGFRVAPLTMHDLMDLEHSRNVIEGAMLVEAISVGDDAWEAAVIGTFHQLSQTPMPSVLLEIDDLAIWTRRHQAFHSALIAGGRSPWMHRFATQIDDQIKRYHLFIQRSLRDLTQTTPHIAEEAAKVFSTAMGLTPHQALFDAVLRRDGIAAQVAFEAHTRLSLNAFSELTNLMPAESQFATTLGTQAEATL